MMIFRTTKQRVYFTALLMFLVIASAYAVETITVGSESSAPGTQVIIPVSITNASSIAGMNFGITYDAAILSNPAVAKGSLVPDDFTLDSNKVSDGEFRFLFYKDPTANINAGAGIIVNLTFDVSAGANGGQTSAINVMPANFGVSNDQGISTVSNYQITNGVFTVSGPSMPITDNFEPPNWTYFPSALGMQPPDSASITGAIGFSLKDIAGDDNDFQGAAWYRNFDVSQVNPILPIVANNVYRATFKLYSPDIPKYQIPEIRFRTSALNNQKTNILGINSQGLEPQFPPGTTPTTYHAYFVPAENYIGKENIILLDMFRVDPTDPISGTLYMDEFQINRSSFSNLGTATLVREYTFDGTPDAEGWFNTGQFFTANQPDFSAGNGKFTITGKPEAGLTALNYGYWQNNVSFPSYPMDPNPVTMEANKLYKVTYTVSSTQADIVKVSTFRVRVNAENFESSYIVLIDSANEPENNLAPDAAGKDYAAFFVADGSQVGQKLIFAFDYLNLPNSNDSGDISLENIKVETYPVPSMF